MSTLLVLVALAAGGVYLNATFRRLGHLPAATMARTAGVVALLLYAAIEGSHFALEYAWWRELGQLGTFWQFLRIRWLPQAAAALLGALVLVLAFRWGARHAGETVVRTRLFRWGGTLLAIGLGVGLSFNLVDPWVIVLYRGARDTGAYRDPLFGKDLAFYLFRLPFYQMAYAWAAAMAGAGLLLGIGAAVVGASARRLTELREQMQAQVQGRMYVRPVREFDTPRLPVAGLVRAAAVLLLALFAVAEFFARYGLLYSRHDFIFGADFVDVRLGIPLLWAQMAGAAGLALLVVAARRRPAHAPGPEWMPADAPGWLAPAVAIGFMGLWIAPALVQGLVRSVWVRPNELTLERPYIADHIYATLMAFDLEQRSHEEPFTPRPVESLDLSRFPETSQNLKLWDAPQFLDNVGQLQALRPYYEFPNADVDRYSIGGQMRQVLLAARVLDPGRLAQSAQSWVNLNIEYTHGYGAVAALVNSATGEGQPELILKNAPPESAYPELRIQRPEIYFGEQNDRPVFVDTRQPEFDYPKGDDNSYTTYAGSAGIRLSNPLWRMAAAIDQDDTNVLLSSYLTPRTRLVLHRQIVERVQTLAPFLLLDPDPYLVIDGGGRLFWMLDAYTTADQHPYAEPLQVGDQEINYIRNSVKITVDAYNGTVRMYVFDETDPVLADYRRVFPQLFSPRTEMPADLQAHIRYPQLLFQAQAETYRLYHMRDPQVFYNKEDQWDIARQVVSQEESQPTAPYYVMLKLPGEARAEFALLLPFTSHGRDNLISWLAARCDPDHYGQIVFYRLPKEQLVYGPLQIQSRVDQDRDISKDLSLWNQQGSRVIRGTTLVLPVDNTFLYVEPIYIQATQAKLPELKKLVLAVGNRLVYADDLPQAMAALAQAPNGEPLAAAPAGERDAAATTTAPAALPRAVLESIRQHMERYRQLTAAGDFAGAGAELHAVEDELTRALQSGH